MSISMKRLFSWVQAHPDLGSFDSCAKKADEPSALLMASGIKRKEVILFDVTLYSVFHTLEERPKQGYARQVLHH
jgi:hypothetical protein